MIISNIKRPDLKDFLDENVKSGKLEIETYYIKNLNFYENYTHFPRGSQEIIEKIVKENPNMKCNVYTLYRSGWNVIYKFIQAIELF